MHSSQPTTRQPRHSHGPRRGSTSGGSKIAVSPSCDSRYKYSLKLEQSGRCYSSSAKLEATSIGYLIDLPIGQVRSLRDDGNPVGRALHLCLKKLVDALVREGNPVRSDSTPPAAYGAPKTSTMEALRSNARARPWPSVRSEMFVDS